MSSFFHQKKLSQHWQDQSQPHEHDTHCIVVLVKISTHFKAGNTMLFSENHIAGKRSQHTIEREFLEKTIFIYSNEEKE